MKDSKVNNSCSSTTNEEYVKPSIQVYEMEIEGTILQASGISTQDYDDTASDLTWN